MGKSDVQKSCKLSHRISLYCKNKNCASAVLSKEEQPGTYHMAAELDGDAGAGVAPSLVHALVIAVQFARFKVAYVCLVTVSTDKDEVGW